MANSEESNPLLPVKDQEFETKDEKKSSTIPAAENEEAPPPAAVSIGWTADGLPVGDSMMQRSQWNSGLFSCLGKNDEFCSSDLEVCLLGAMAPCVLHGGTVERLQSTPRAFSNHCLGYTVFYLLGNSLFGGNLFAPWFSYPARTAIRRKFNLEGSCEALTRSCGCCGSLMEDEYQRDQCETGCDMATHIFCHPCALCQEGREVRRRLPHPGFGSQPVLVMIPPGEQMMGRGK